MKFLEILGENERKKENSTVTNHPFCILITIIEILIFLQFYQMINIRCKQHPFIKIFKEI